jgi:UbiD family decarboxylase
MVWFKSVGRERTELVANIMGTRKRIALALGCEERALRTFQSERFAKPIAPVEVQRERAPSQEVVLTGADADFSKLPIHLQHGEDGGPYISATIDVCRDPDTGFHNLGIRRFMLSGRRTAGIDVTAPSDLRAIYQKHLNRGGGKFPMAVAIGSHPSYYVGALAIAPPQDEYALVGGLRGEPCPVVKGITVDLPVPADAEYVLEGYLDDRGWSEPEGPYGEYLGYYGKLKSNPVFHLTAITHRRDALFQTVAISGRGLAYSETTHLGALRAEYVAWDALKLAVREPVDVFCSAGGGGMYNIRVALRQRVPGEARNAIMSVFGSFAEVKHVFVCDDDIDIYDPDQVDWALATRFQADRDLVVATGFRTIPLDPSLAGARTGAKAGFDLTIPFSERGKLEFTVPEPPKLRKVAKKSVREALGDGPKSFREIMEIANSDDGRDVVLELEKLDVARTEDGRYFLK